MTSKSFLFLNYLCLVLITEYINIIKWLAETITSSNKQLIGKEIKSKKGNAKAKDKENTLTGKQHRHHGDVKHGNSTGVAETEVEYSLGGVVTHLVEQAAHDEPDEQVEADPKPQVTLKKHNNTFSYTRPSISKIC